MRMYLTVMGTLHLEHIGVSFLFRSMRVGNVGVTNAKSGEYLLFSFSSVSYRPLTYSILYTVKLVLYLIIPRFCHLSSRNLLMISFRSVYGIFVLDMSARSVFCSFSCPFISMYFNCGLVSR